MNELKNWKEVTRGLYRYVISACVCYEIHVINWWESTDILTADAKLYLVGEWSDKNNGSVFQRELLLKNSLFECINKSVEDMAENMDV